jgi:hypothetical protein
MRLALITLATGRSAKKYEDKAESSFYWKNKSIASSESKWK